MRGQMVLYQELVDVYVFDPNLPAVQEDSHSEDIPVDNSPVAETATEE